MIPEIQMNAPSPYEQEYASSAVATSPSYRRTLKEEMTDVSIEYAAFLIDNDHIKLEDYVIAVFDSRALDDEYDAVAKDHGDKMAEEVIDRMIRNEIEVAVNNNRSFSFKDWV